MIHRHLNHQRFTLAAIDDVIARGGWGDWAELRRAALADRALLDKVDRISRAHTGDPYAQRYHFWMHYAAKHLAGAPRRRYMRPTITLPTAGEILRIKAVLILKRNATRDYLDFVASADHLGESSMAQLQVQLANALPFDLETTELSEYKNLDRRWHDWTTVKATCARAAIIIFDSVCDFEQKRGNS